MSRSIVLTLPTQGTTSVPSVVKATINESRVAQVTDSVFARVRVCDSAGYGNATNATIAASGGCTVVETHTSGKDLTFKSSAAAAATGTLTIAGVVIDTQTVTVGARVYEFDTHSTATITAGRVRVNISASATKAVGTLTLDTQPVANNILNIGGRSYVFVANGTADNDGEISVGTNLATAKTNIVAAVNGTDQINLPNTKASMATFSSNTSLVTALAGGVAGNSLVSTITSVGANAFDAATLGTTTAGVDCSAANAVTALALAIESDASAIVGAVDGAGDTVVITADTAGAAGNDIVSTETMANGSFGAVTLTGGASALPGIIQVALTNAMAEPFRVIFGAPLLGAIDTDWSPVKDVVHAA